MPLNIYREYIKNGNFDIGHAALADDDFSKCKYYNKYIEYGINKISGIYSNVIPYTYVIKNNFNGILANPNEWYEKLCLLIDNFDLRKNIINNSYFDLQNNLSSEKILNKLFLDIPEFLNYNSLNTKIYYF